MNKLGLIGKDISHSKSQRMYEKLLSRGVNYHLLDYKDNNDIPALNSLFDQGFEGLSVTYPYKLSFETQLSEKSERVDGLNAINCIKRVDNQILAINTDFLAAEFLLKKEIKGDFSFVVLGSGNMATVFDLVFKRLGQSYIQKDRRKDGDLNSINFLNLCESNKKLFLINCCARSFVFSGDLPSGSVFWDMNYAFPEHDHLKNRLFSYRSGEDLLYEQAKFALEFWGIT